VKILQVHNFYQIPGGEDKVVDNEKKILEKNGHDVYQFFSYSAEIDSIYQKLKTAVCIKSSRSARNKFINTLEEIHPDIVHVHNFFPLITPEVFRICHQKNIPVVFTLHNYRIICPTLLLMWKGEVTERSIKEGPWWAVPEKVYKNSLLGTAALAYLIDSCKRENFWNKYVSRFIALTEFSKSKFVQFGIESSRIVVKPNFVIDPFPTKNNFDRVSDYAIYVGRLGEEKGIKTLLSAWKNVDKKLTLRIIGDGPMRSFVESHATDHVVYLGYKNNEEIKELMLGAAMMILPSEWYEGFPMVCVEAFSCGLPVIASDIGSLREIILNSGAGELFEPQNPVELASVVNAFYESGKYHAYSRVARDYYRRHYTAEINARMLIDIYQGLVLK